MVIDVGPAAAEAGEGLAAVVGHLNEHIHHVNAVFVFRIDNEMGVILGLGFGGIAFLPGDAAIG